MLAAPLATLLIASFFIPLGSLLSLSLFDPDLTLAQYRKIFESETYSWIMLRTLRDALVCAVLTLAAGYPVAFLMARTKGITTLLIAACVLIPLWTSLLIRTYSWAILLQTSGVFNSVLMYLGVINAPLKLLYTEGAVIVAMCHVLAPFMILPVYSAIKSIPAELERAAQVMGAGKFRTFLAVTLPMSLPGVFAGCVIVTVLALGFYITPALLGGPDSLVVATLIAQETLQTLNWPFASAVSFTLLAAALGIMFTFQRFLGVEKFTNV
jgi:mannopine transport system permease protein